MYYHLQVALSIRSGVCSAAHQAGAVTSVSFQAGLHVPPSNDVITDAAELSLGI